jgi:azurin
MTAVLVITAMPSSDRLGELVYAAAVKPENGNDEWLSKALLAAAITHENGFRTAAAKAPPASPEMQMSSFPDRITRALSQEIYSLPRRGSLLYPPDVTGKEIIIKGIISRQDQRELQGVIVAQGGKDAGYGLYIQNGKLNMVVKQGGKTYKATSTGTLPDKFDLLASLSASGVMSMSVDGKEVARAKAASLFKEPLVHGVRIGQDYNNENKMGDYEGTYFLTANMQSASMELKRPGKTGEMSSAGVNKSAIKNKNGSETTDQPVAKVLKPVTINVKVVPNVIQFNKKLLTVKAGQKVTITLENPDVMQHNMVIIKPGTLQKVGAAADALARDPNGAQKQYVPRMPEVLWFIKLLNPDEEGSMQFTAPSQPGDYPFVCTFPGHWRIMNGILRVTK